MNEPRPATSGASRDRCRRHLEPGSALTLAVAGALLIATMAAAPDFPWMWAPTSRGDVSSTILSPSRAAAPAPVAVRLATDSPTPVVESLVSLVARRYRVARESAREMVRAAFREGRRNGVDPLLILAVIAVESRFNPIAESDQGAMGLMQIMPRFHLDKFDAVDAMLQPHANIAAGARILRDSIRRGGGEIAGLQLYNGAPDDETQAYANRVLTERRRLEAALPHARGHG
jgi:soluble lytic murein transglycosylase-like protein